MRCGVERKGCLAGLMKRVGDQTSVTLATAIFELVAPKKRDYQQWGVTAVCGTVHGGICSSWNAWPKQLSTRSRPRYRLSKKLVGLWSSLRTIKLSVKCTDQHTQPRAKCIMAVPATFGLELHHLATRSASLGKWTLSGVKSIQVPVKMG